VLQESLGRVSQNVFDLAGLKLLDELQAIQDSLGRCLQYQQEPSLRHWYELLRHTLPNYGQAFSEVRQAQEWLDGIRGVLEEAPLPTKTEPGVGAAAVAQSLAHLLGVVADRGDLSPWLRGFRDHLLELSERYWSGLFVCYDLVGLPRTNNELESLFGQTRRRVRRQSGFKQLRRCLMRQGAWLIYQPADSFEDLKGQLEGVPHEVYRAERERFEQRQARFGSRYRWQHNRSKVLSQLEAQWSSVRADST